MTLITYPLDNTSYTSEDAALYHAARTSGIFAGEDFGCTVTGADNLLTLEPGLAWLRLSRWRGVCAALKTQATVDLGLPDAVYPRLDRVVLQFDASKNCTQVAVKKGTAAPEPQSPERLAAQGLYELHLWQIRREPGAVSISAGDVTDLRLDPDCCGLMADAVTRVDTSAIQAQVADLLQQLRREILQLEAGTAVELKKLQFSNVAVEAAAFAAHDAYPGLYPFRAALALEGCLESMTPEVIFAMEEAAGGNFAPVAETYDGGVYLYAKTVPASGITIPAIICWRGAA